MWNWIAKVEELRAKGLPFAVVTVTQCNGSTPRETGAKLIACPDGDFYGTIGGGHLEELALVDARKCIEEGDAKVIKYPLGAKTGQCCGGTVELLFEPINSGPRLYLFGAGHVGQAVARTLEGTPLQVHVIDERREWIRSPELSKGAIRHEGRWDEFVQDAIWDDRTFVAVMTHRHDLDQEIIEFVARKPARYVGLIGSESKKERFRQRMSQKGFGENEIARIRCPIGIDLGGGKAPQEVAVSLAAELLRLHYEAGK